MRLVTTILRPLFFVMVLAVSPFLYSASAQISHGGEPKSNEISDLESAERVTFPAVNVEALLEEDRQEQLEADRPKPPRFAFAHDVSITPENSGTWTELEDGSRIWRVELHSASAYSINLVYENFYLPEGSELFIYNSDKSHVLGAFNHLNNKEYGKFSSGPVPGDRTTLEYFEPAEVSESVQIEISKVAHAYRNLFGANRSGATNGNMNSTMGDPGYGQSQYCHINVNCPEGDDWRDEQRAVSMIINDSGTRSCSGFLINNAMEDRTPYFMTAEHCKTETNEDVAEWTFLFNYESPSCSNQDGPTDESISGATTKARHHTSDFLLLELSSRPPASYETFYLGWDRSGSAPPFTTGIHHPMGDIKKISLDYDAPIKLSEHGEEVWEMLLDDGFYERGSSGSPLLSDDGKAIGQLWRSEYGSPRPTCDIRREGPYYFGRMDASWDGGGTAGTRLKDWLDPNDTGISQLDGMEGPMAAYITGPYSACEGEPITYNSHIIGGNSTRTFQWEESVGGNEYFETGTGESQDTHMAYDDLYMRLTVDDGVESDVSNYMTRHTDCDGGGPGIGLRADEISGIPDSFELHSPAPNPFEQSTTLRYDLPEDTHVRVDVYDVQGRRVITLIDQHRNAGVHMIEWAPRNLPSGMYIINLQAAEYTNSASVMFVR